MDYSAHVDEIGFLVNLVTCFERLGMIGVEQMDDISKNIEKNGKKLKKIGKKEKNKKKTEKSEIKIKLSKSQSFGSE